MKYKRMISLFIAILFVFSTVFQVYAQSISDLKKQQSEIQSQIEQTKKELESMQSESKTVENQIKELDLKISNAQSELDSVEKELEIINANIEKAEKDLEEAEKNIADKTETFNQRLRVMYKNGNVGYLEVLLSSGDIKDFLSRQTMIESIAEQDKELLQYMKEQRDIVEQKKVELEAQRASVEITKSKLESRKRDLETVSRQKEDLMGRLVKDIDAYEKEYDKLNDYAKQIESKIVELQRNTNSYSGGVMLWPVEGYSRISSSFGYRIHPVFNVQKLHTGIDIPAPTGTAVRAASDGIVIYADWLGSYGKAVMIDHGSGIVTLYAHNSSILVSEGETVSRGQSIAKIGSTGVSTGPHLHFEVRKNGAYVDPISWLK